MIPWRRQNSSPPEFQSTLLAFIKGRARKVRTMIGDRGNFPMLYGIVPENPLRAGIEITKRVIRFRTR